MVVYNATQYLELSLRSLLTVADEVIVVDGPYENYPHTSPMSDDGTLEIVEEYQKLGAPITLIKKRTPWSTQMEKRNKYFEYGEVGDLMFILDGDCQVIATDYAMDRLRHSDADGFQATDMKTISSGHVIRIDWSNPYVLKKTTGMHYDLNHYSIYDAEGRHVYFSPYRIEPLYGNLIVYHHGEQRSPQKIRDNDAYYSTRVEYADGREEFVCGKCGKKVKLQRGERMKCPYCGWWELCADVIYDLPKVEQAITS